MGKKTISFFLIVLLPVIFGFHCTSGEVLIQPKLTGKEKVIRRVKGEGCGFIGLLATAYYFFPIELNSRVEKAYDRAMSQVPGAVGLTNIVIEEDWYWVVLGTVRCTSITGDAVQ